MTPLFAGMPRVSVLLTEPAAVRLDVISFFLLVLALSTAAVRYLWNGLARDFPRLPRLTWRGAAGLVLVWGAAFTLVLAMISGARELMTPGAWKPSGPTYALADAPVTEADRRQALDDLKAKLWEYAKAHGGELPAGGVYPTPHPAGVPYVVRGGKVDPYSRGVLVAVEPDVFGGVRLALFADGMARPATAAELEALAGGKP